METGRKRAMVSFIVLGAIGYFLIFPEPLPKELIPHPAWCVPLSASGLGEAGASPLLAFYDSSNYGYASAEGAIVLYASDAFGVAIDDERCLPYDRVPSSLAAMDSQGRKAFELPAEGYPYFEKGRIFLLASTGNGIAEYGARGARAWSRELKSPIVAVSAGKEELAIVCLDGSVEVLDKGGAESFAFSPGGSRISSGLGVALSPDGRYLASITGIDKARLVVYERASRGYRIIAHKALAPDFRRAVSMHFSEDSMTLFYEGPDGPIARSMASGAEFALPIPAQGFKAIAWPERGLVMGLSSSGGEKRLACAAPDGSIVLQASIPGPMASFKRSGSRFFTLSGGLAIAFDLEER